MAKFKLQALWFSAILVEKCDITALRHQLLSCAKIYHQETEKGEAGRLYVYLIGRAMWMAVLVVSVWEPFISFHAG